MTKETALDKILATFGKLSLDESIEVFNDAGRWLHSRIEEHQQNLAAINKKLDSAKEKIKPE
jgi:hypothetical protein